MGASPREVAFSPFKSLFISIKASAWLPIHDQHDHHWQNQLMFNIFTVLRIHHGKFRVFHPKLTLKLMMLH